MQGSAAFAATLRFHLAVELDCEYVLGRSDAEWVQDLVTWSRCPTAKGRNKIGRRVQKITHGISCRGGLRALLQKIQRDCLVAVWEFNLSYYIWETLLLTIYVPILIT